MPIVTRFLRIVLASGLTAAAISSPSTAHAANESQPAIASPKMTISPTILEVSGRAGATLSENLSVTASGNVPIQVSFRHADFGFSDSGYQVVLIQDNAAETTAFSTRGWFSIPQKRYLIATGQTVTIPLKIQIPANTPGGTHLGAALLRVEPSKGAESATVRAISEAGPLVFISVAGGKPPRPVIDKFQIPGIVAGGPIRPDITVANTGDEWFAFDGTITLERTGKDEVVEISRQFVVPGQPRDLRISANDKGTKGRPVLGAGKLGFGHHTITTKLRIDPTGTTITSKRTFWVIPMWVRILGALAVVALLASIGWTIRWGVLRRRQAAFLLIAPDYDDEFEEDDLLS